MAAQRKACDLAIVGGTVIDGTGGPRRRADVYIDRGRIVALGSGEMGYEPDVTLQAAGQMVAPGFIDVHSHDDRAVLVPEQILPKLSQGVTTVVTGNCGISLAPYQRGDTPPPTDLVIQTADTPGALRFASFAHYMETLDSVALTVNVAPLVGHTSLRLQAMKDIDREADATEIAVMRQGVEQAMQAGAWGLSSGVFYPPARAATTRELIEVGRPLTAAAGHYVTHLRDEANNVLESMAEAFAIGRALDVNVVLSHHKVVGVCNHGRSTETLAAIVDAAKSQPVALDCYPYHASSTVLRPEFLYRARRTRVTWSTPFPQMAGRMLDEIAAEWGVSEEEAATRLVPAGAIYYAMDEQDVQRILAFEPTMIGSDGIPHDAFPHPRLWGTFPRVLGHYARELKLFALETAVHKMTGRPAQTFRMADRGVLAPGHWADVVVFDPTTIADRATFDEPTRPSAGIACVLVNGEVAYTPQAGAQARAGAGLRRSS